MTAPDAELVLEALEDLGLEAAPVGERRWMTTLAGEHKRTIPVLVELDERSLRVTSLFVGVPDEAHAEVYRILLERNQRPQLVHFALDDEGDVILVGHVATSNLSAQVIDELLGQLLTMADETFNQVLRAGFASYIDAEQRWRAKVGLSPNPVGSSTD